MKEPGKKPSLREQWASISLEQKLAMFVAPVVVFVITAVLIPTVRDAVREAFTTHPTVTTPVDLVPCDSRIEISMRNIGRLVSVVTQAEFRIRAMQTIDIHCRGSGAALPISQTYDLKLPAHDGVGQVVGVAVRQQLKPNEADAFAFRVGLAGALVGDGDPRLYQLDVLVHHDREPKPIDAGTIVLAVGSPGRISFEPSEDADSQERECLRNNVGRAWAGGRRELTHCRDRLRTTCGAYSRAACAAGSTLWNTSRRPCRRRPV